MADYSKYLVSIGALLLALWFIKAFKRQPHKIVKHAQTIRRQIADELLNVFDHFAGLTLKGLKRDHYHLYLQRNRAPYFVFFILCHGYMATLTKSVNGSLYVI